MVRYHHQHKFKLINLQSLLHLIDYLTNQLTQMNGTLIIQLAQRDRLIQEQDRLKHCLNAHLRITLQKNSRCIYKQTNKQTNKQTKYLMISVRSEIVSISNRV